MHLAADEGLPPLEPVLALLRQIFVPLARCAPPWPCSSLQRVRVPVIIVAVPLAAHRDAAVPTCTQCYSDMKQRASDRRPATHVSVSMSPTPAISQCPPCHHVSRHSGKYFHPVCVVKLPSRLSTFALVVHSARACVQVAGLAPDQTLRELRDANMLAGSAALQHSAFRGSGLTVAPARLGSCNRGSLQVGRIE